MKLFDKLLHFRRLVDSVPHYRSRNNYYKRLLTRIASFNLDSDFTFINLKGKDFNNTVCFRLVDTIEVCSYCDVNDDIFIDVYVCVTSDMFMNSIYYKVNV